MKYQNISEAHASAKLLELAGGLWVSRALWAAAHLRLADHIDREAVSVAALAGATDTAPEPLGRLLGALASVGVFRLTSSGGFLHSPLSLMLRSDHPRSQRAFVDSVFGQEHYAAWGAFEGALRTGVPGFDLHYGKPGFDWFAEHPEAGALFGEAMTGATCAMEEALLAAHDFGPFELAVDVGGSHGSFLRRLLVSTPAARGILFDLPGTVVEGEPKWRDTPEAARLTAVGGDFFGDVPAGGDLYLLKFILHDWTDHKAVAILSKVRSAMRPDGAVAIVEMVLPDDPAEPHPGRFVDLNMLAITGGRERSAAAYGVLLRAAGLRISSVTPTSSPLSVIVARPL